MPRLTQLSEVLFPVDVHPVFASVRTGKDERRFPVMISEMIKEK